MNVAHCIHGLSIGGAQKIVQTLVAGSDRESFRTFVYCCLDGPMRPDVEAAGATVRVLPRLLPKLDPAWAWRLARAMRRDGIELVHTHLFGDSLHGYLAARLAGGLPVVMTVHAKPELHNALQGRGYRYLLARSAAVVACSESTHRAYVDAGWPGVERFVTILNGIAPPPAVEMDPDARRKARAALGLDPDAVVFCSVGRLSPEKGLDVLIRAFAALVRKVGDGVRLAIIGTGPKAAELEELARAEGVAERVVFAGFRSNVPAFLPALDVVVFSSTSEGLSVAMLEAMATERPLVGTEVEGILEAIRHEREGLIVPVGDVAALAAALERLVDPELRRRLGRAAGERFRATFTAERMVAGYEDLYREVVARRNGR